MNKPENIPAFPVPELVLDDKSFQPDNTGMTLRDYFAGQSLAMLADPNIIGKPEMVAKSAYEYADAMLLERNKTNE